MPEKIDNAVQSKVWYKELPRACYSNYEKIDVDNNWFEVYKLPKNIYAIYEPGHFQEVISFLIPGEKKSILFDTGLGIGNIKVIAEKLVENKIMVVNSHCHFDHIGCNHLFEEVAIFNNERALNRLKKGYSKEELRGHLENHAVCKDYPQGFDPNNYHILPTSNPIVLNDKNVIDLGNRKLTVIHTPGHSEDSIMLYDKDNKLLFTGDTIYPAALYAHFNSDFYGYSDFDTYLDTLLKLGKLVPSLEYLFTSHNEPIMKPDKILDIIDGFKIIKGKKAPYVIDRDGLRRYDFNGFSVIV